MKDMDDKDIAVNKNKIIEMLQAELNHAKKERDAAVADLTEFAKFYRRRTICDFCKYDSDECDANNDNYFINDYFEWRNVINEF